ncbi:MAG: hypothetical protein Q7T55_17615 [Solirubrobacteraceae bacterium]|nr:hypothetical protein [Solirubrobacteraceae bacterium]
MASKLSSLASRLAPVISRAAQNFALDGRFLRSPYETRSARLRFLVAKYIALTTGRSSIGWFGRELS